MNKLEISFSDFGLNNFLLKSLEKLGYKNPSPIQKACIPLLLKGYDVLGLAQTGSGKTAAFALPLLHKINIDVQYPQILILTPTRELAIQIAQAMNDFSIYINNIKILAIYGGQRYEIQFNSLKNGQHIIVGTPGRILDHLKRKTLDLSYINSLVLDEADEMLRMGFIEDVESIMKNIPIEHQTALFSATMPKVIKDISHRFMKNPKEIRIQNEIKTRPNIIQNYFYVFGVNKKEALIRFLECEYFDAAIIFVRTKISTIEVAEIVESNGYKSAALNGNMTQELRESTLNRLKNKNLDILIATDVAARGLDFNHISLVINYDIPLDVESYIHRIGRTGRAGRSGKAILFVEKKEKKLLRNIERNIKILIKEIKLPNINMLAQCRLDKFKIDIKKYLIEENNDLDKYRELFKKLQYQEKNTINIETLGAILLKLAQGKRPLIISHENIMKYDSITKNKNNIIKYNKNKKMNLYRIEVGRNHGVEIKHIIEAISTTININNIGNIKLFLSYSIIELSNNISKKIFSIFKNTRIFNRPINISPIIKESNLKNNKSNFKKSENKKLYGYINKEKFKYNKNKNSTKLKDEKNYSQHSIL